jgi:sortase A
VVSLSADVQSPTLEDLRSGGEEAGEPEEQVSVSRRKRAFDRLLLVIEVVAVLGLVFIIFNGLDLIRQLNQQVAEVLEQPTLTPTPLIVAVVLPSGHTPPNSPGGARPNDAEIPDHLRPLVQSLASVPVPTPGPEQASRIQIQTIGVDAPIVQGDGWEQLKRGVGQHIGSANPGQDGNVVLSAHNDIFGEIFRHLDQLQPGDEVTVYTNRRAHTYVITGWEVVEPTAVEVMAPTKDATLTLISCYPYLVDDERIVVKATLQE